MPNLSLFNGTNHRSNLAGQSLKSQHNLDKFILNTRVFCRAKRLIYYLALNDFTVLCDMYMDRIVLGTCFFHMQYIKLIIFLSVPLIDF
jgi:hypothetical protein